MTVAPPSPLYLILHRFMCPFHPSVREQAWIFFMYFISKTPKRYYDIIILSSFLAVLERVALPFPCILLGNVPSLRMKRCPQCSLSTADIEDSEELIQRAKDNNLSSLLGDPRTDVGRCWCMGRSARMFVNVCVWVYTLMLNLQIQTVMTAYYFKVI